MAKFYHTGEKPGIGSFVCTNCGTELTITDKDKMPTCPKCTNTSFNKRSK